MSDTLEHARIIPFDQKFHIGLIRQGPYIITTIIANSLLIFYTDYIGLKQVWIFGLAYFLFGFWNAVNDPIFGYYSDIRVSKGGLRVPLMKIGMPIMLAGFFMLVLVPRGWADWNIFLILLFGLVIFDFGKALSMVNYDAFCITIANNPKERARLNLVVSYVGIIPGALIGVVPAYFLTGDFTYIQILLLFIALVVIFFVLTWYSLMRLKEPSDIYLIKQSNEREQDKKDTNAFTLKEGFSQTLTSKPFIVLLVFRFIVFFYHGLYYTNLIYMMKWVIGIQGILALLVAGAGGIMINVMYPIIMKIRNKIGTIKTIRLGILMGIPGYIMMFFATDIWTLTIGYVISTISFSGLFFEGVLLGDISDDDYLRTRKQKKGMFVSIYGFFNTLSNALVILVYTLALTYFRYDGELPAQSDFTILGLRILAAILPISAALLAFIVLRFFPLQGERYEQLRVEVDKLYSKKEEPNPTDIKDS